VRVLIADDQRVVREGLATILSTIAGMEVVGLAADGAEAVAMAGESRPDVVLMDLRMPNLDGVGAIRALRQADPDARVVVLTTYADDDSVFAALSAGAMGFLTKDAGRDDIRRSLEAAVAGQSVLDAGVQAALVRAAVPPAAVPPGATPSATGPLVAPAPAPSPALPDGLTAREVEVLTLIAAGLSNSEIAERLYLGEATVKTHINRIFAKTGSRDRAQAAAYAFRHGLAR
jgi:DNA-binding NarL/FixJ family response regulator